MAISKWAVPQKDRQLNVVAYARVSTDEEEQAESLQSQIEYFQQLIKGNDDWKYTGIYVDKGITGTSAKKRPEFLRMIREANQGKFDVILTREVSRFARNTVDTLQYTRELKKLGIAVIFTIDNISTFDNEGELRLSLMATIAQEEARKTSNNVKWKHEHLMKNGVVFGNRVYGYYLKDGKLTINPEEAEVVILIFNLYLQGYGLKLIQQELYNRKIPSPTGKDKWTPAVISKLLKNEKYIGVLKQKKTITPDYLEKKKKINNGEVPYIIVENSHDPIINKEDYELVQKAFASRRELQNLNHTKYSNRYIWSGKLVCGDCGWNLKRQVWNTRADGGKTFAWKCSQRANYGNKTEGSKEGCNFPAVPEERINKMFKRVLEEIYTMKNEIIFTLEKTIEKHASKSNKDFSKQIEDINKNIEKYKRKNYVLLENLSDETISKHDYKTKKAENDKIIEQYLITLSQFDEKLKENTNEKSRLEKLKEILHKDLDFSEEELPKEVIDNLLSHIIIKGKNKFEVYLNMDLAFDVTYDKNNFDISTMLWYRPQIEWIPKDSICETKLQTVVIHFNELIYPQVSSQSLPNKCTSYIK